MDLGTQTGRRVFVGQSGIAAFAALALGTGLRHSISAQEGTPDAALLTGTPAIQDTPLYATPLAGNPDSERVAANLARFDEVDFVAWNNRDWDLFREIHGDAVHVEGGGVVTEGIDAHIAFSMAAVEANPEFRILAHPIQIGIGDWTAVIGVITGGSKMCTVVRWEDGTIAEEYVFFDIPSQ